MTGRIIAFCLLSAILAALLDGLGFKSKKLFSLLAFALLVGATIGPISKIFNGIMSFSDAAGIGDAARAAAKAVGLGYLFGFVSDICEGLGEGSIATGVTLVGRIEIFLVAYPFFESIMKLGMELLE